jgi:Chitobiase/beta-hexosaminidase C-terminal domain
MKMSGITSTLPGPVSLIGRGTGLILGALLLPLAGVWPLSADTTVTTLGGGRLSPTGPDAGFSDGDILQSSQFRTPFGCAVDLAGRVYVADRDNGALRQLDLAANRCRTLLRSLHQPVAVAVDAAGAAYVLTQGDGTIWKLDRGLASAVTTQLSLPTAMAYDGESAALFVTQSGGSVVRVSLADGSVSPPLLTGLNEPGGIALLDSGLAAISETGGHMVRIWDLRSGSLAQQIGAGLSGFADGPANQARFNRPFQLAKAPGGSVVVADCGNDRVRLIESDGFVSTVYGVDPSAWEGPICLTCDPLVLPGWLDGSAEFAEAREPVGVAVSNDGTIYTTEIYYHLVREITGAAFNGGSGPGPTNVVVLPPAISPSSGYYPMGQVITVANPNASSLLASAVYYTTDGSEPTTNSLRVPMDGQTGSFVWQEKQHDLTSLRLKAFLGNTPSDTVSGLPVAQTEIGAPQDIAAGIGSLAVVPIVVNLSTNDQLQSLQFRVELTPASPGTPPIADTFQALSISTNDFIPLFAGGGKGEAKFQTLSYSAGATRGLAVTFIGTNASLMLKGFGVAALLAVPIPSSARLGDQYMLNVLNPSGTADSAEQRVSIVPMPARTVVVTDARYEVGDSSPAIWYNAAQMDAAGALRRGFGDGLLDNSDVNNVFAAALGVRVPFPNTDLFDAMDAFPEDTVGSAGGDGVIRFLDWQVVLMRSLGLESVNWERSWSEGGLRVSSSLSGATGAASLPGQALVTPLPGAVWSPQAALSAGQLENLQPGATVDVPISVQVAPGYEVAGLAFRATVQPESTAPALERPVEFIPGPDLSEPAQTMLPSPDTMVCGWPLVPAASFDPPLRGTALLGCLRVILPATARSGDAYVVRFSNADGSPDLQTQYDFETKPGWLWVLSKALVPPDPTSDQWKLHFFGSTTSDSARPDADPDHDGAPNWAEYAAGTNPTDARSYLHLESAQMDSGSRSLILRWLSAPGKLYRIESAPSPLSNEWAVLASDLPGDGNVQQWVFTSLTSNSGFFRIRLQP